MEFEITHWYWWVFVCIFLILEALAPGVIFLWLAIASGVLGLLMLFFPSLDFSLQLFLFALLSLGSAVTSTFVVRRWQQGNDEDDFEEHPGRFYVDRVLTLTDPIVNGRGRIPLDDSIWKITGPDTPAGSRVKVVGVEGILLKVEPLEDEE